MLPRHGRCRDADIRTRALDAVAGRFCGERVVYERIVGGPGDGDEGAGEEGDEEERCY